MPFPDSYTEFIYKRTYSRWDDEKGRRETWDETVSRYFEFIKELVPSSQKRKLDKAKQYVLQLKVMPSMRALWSAGEPLKDNNITGYNCSYVVIDKPKIFSDIMFILMCGTGVGFSVERQYVINLPTVPFELKKIEDTIVFGDSREGWAEGFNALINFLYEGKIPNFNLDKIRPEGAVLKTFGGRASGPRPLKRLLEFTISLFKQSNGRKLSSLECHDLVCCICDVVVAGGTRRSATISFSNLSDQRMKHAKDGAFWEKFPYRSLANNSVAYTEKPDMYIFMEEWLSLARSGTGERGIFNREGAKKIVSSNGRRDPNYEWGGNPCLEIILRPEEFCNLTEVVVRENDTLYSLCEKVKIATILGCIQSTLTDFPVIDEQFKKNCEEERLLGVSLTGTCDHPTMGNLKNKERIQDWLNTMKLTAIETAEKWSSILGINMPAAITCVKPSGTVSQLVNSSSGIHTRYSPYYIRRVRVAKTDPISKFLIDRGIPYNPEINSSLEDATTLVFDFYIKSPKNSVCREEMTAIEQLEYWKLYQEYWCEHKPSITIYVKDSEWLETGAWVYKNWDLVSGVSFLPYDGGLYELTPYEEIDSKTYEEKIKDFPRLDFSELSEYEKSDMTEGSKEYACIGGVCEL